MADSYGATDFGIVFGSTTAGTVNARRGFVSWVALEVPVATTQYGASVLPLTLTCITNGTRIAFVEARTTLLVLVSLKTEAADAAVLDYPTYMLELARTDTPLATSPTYTDISSRMRAVSTERGRSYEFDRIEAGTSEIVLNNRDSALNPENTASPYYPLKHTRQVRLRARFGTSFPVYKGFSQGYPQSFPAYGHDAIVRLSAIDIFYALAIVKLTPGSTTLSQDIDAVSVSIPVADETLPMPQVLPFVITIDSEDMDVTAVQVGSYTATRGHNNTLPATHASGATVSAHAVSFGEALSGTRISEVLNHVGIPTALTDIDAGQTIITASNDLVGTSPLEHIQLITETEFGRFFADRSGVLTFQDRHSSIFQYLLEAPIGTLVDGLQYTEAAGQIPYLLKGEVAFSEARFFNRVRLTLPDGQVIDLKDQASIDDHFERVQEKTLPYADFNQASDAAQFMLNRLSTVQMRVPALELQGAVNPAVLWPTLLGMELGQHFNFEYQPQGGGTEIVRSLILDRISHRIAPSRHVIDIELTPADTTTYWILETAGFSELEQTTTLTY